MGIQASRSRRHGNNSRKDSTGTIHYSRLRCEVLESRQLLSAGSQQLQLFSASPALFVENQGQWADASVRYMHQGDRVNVALTDSGPLGQLLQTEATGQNVSSTPPAVAWSSYLGGSDGDWGNAIAVDNAGNVYVTGGTSSSNWTYGGFDTTFNGSSDVFVAKLTPAGELVWSTYFGGSFTDYGTGIAIDGDSNVYLVGDTASAGWIGGGSSTSYNGGFDGFLLKLTSNGIPVWGTYLGGAYDDLMTGVVVDRTGAIYVTGETASPGWTGGGFDTTYNGATDAFVAKFTNGGSHVWSTYVGGSDTDYARGIAVDTLGNIYVAGETASFGWTTGGFDTTYNGGTDGFVAKLTPNGALSWSTYVGGANSDAALGIALDALGSAYVVGWTWSPGWTIGGFDAIYGGNGDGYLLKLASNGALAWSTYLGGTGYDHGWAVATSAVDEVYITGTSYSPGWTTDGFNTTYAGDGDAFLVSLSGSGAHLWSSYLGGNAHDQGRGVVAISNGSIYITGQSDSAGWTSGGHDTSYNGFTDAFVAKISRSDTNPPTPNPSTWATPPYAKGSTSIRMVATTATDPEGNGVEYYFRALTAGGHDSGWQDSPIYEDTGLSPNTTYNYQVKTRDKSPNRNEGEYSMSASCTPRVIIDLGTLGGQTSSAYAINNRGQIVGQAATTTGAQHAFLYTNGTMLDLGTLGGTESQAGDINERGQVVGGAKNASGHWRAFLYSNGTMIDLGTLGGTDSYANGINDRGQVVGWSYTDTGAQHAFLYTDGMMIDLGVLPGGGNSGANAINDKGEVVGGADTSSGAWHAFLYRNGAMIDLGTFGGDWSCAYEVNEGGQAVGYSDTQTGTARAFLYSDGTMNALGTLLGFSKSYAYGINTAGQVVGYSEKSDGTRHAFLYNNGTMTDLGTLGGTSSNAICINDRGQVVGSSQTASGAQRAFLVNWDIIPPMPNPSTWATPPYGTGSTSIRMVATTATDPEGNGVEYYFRALTAGGHDSGWQDSPIYEDTGLSPNTTYTYQVKTRDKSPNRNEGGYSVSRSATTQQAATKKIDVELVVTPTLRSSDTAAVLPQSISTVPRGAVFYVEVWVKNADGYARGIVGGYVDFSYNQAVVSAGAIGHGAIYKNATSGAATGGRVDDLGGIADPGVTDKGDDEWVRLGYVQFTALAEGSSNFTSAAGAGQFARVGEGAIPWGDVEFNVPPILVEIRQAVLPMLAIDDASVIEGDSGAKILNFTVSISGANALGASVNYATADATATAGSDYVAASGTLTWLPGDTAAKSISVTINGDTVFEPDETFFVNLSGAINATLGDGQAVGTIVNDEPAEVEIDLPGGKGTNAAVVFRQGNNLVVVNNRREVFNRPLDSFGGMIIRGVDNKSDSVTVDFTAGGPFAVPGEILFDGRSGAAADHLVLRGDADANTFLVRGDHGQLGELRVHWLGVERLTLDGGPGADTYQLFDLRLPITLIDRAGVDVLDFSSAASSVTIDLSASGGQAQRVFAPANTTRLALKGTFENVIGSPQADRIKGNSAANTIWGGPGDDVIWGNAGNDSLFGGQGNDWLYGGEGDDMLFGGPGDNVLLGGAGNDRLFGAGDGLLAALAEASGRNLLIGGTGRDELRGGDGEDILIGGATRYDGNAAALAAVMQEWTSRAPFEDRWLHLGVTGIPFGKTTISLKLRSTVPDDKAADTLFGGLSPDWFLGFGNDVVQDRTNEDR